MTNKNSFNPPPRLVLGYGGGGRPTGETAKQAQATVSRLFGYLKPYRWRLAVVAVLVIAGTLFALAGPILLGIAIDAYIATSDMNGLMRTVLLMLGAALGAGVAGIIHSLMMIDLG